MKIENKVLGEVLNNEFKGLRVKLKWITASRHKWRYKDEDHFIANAELKEFKITLNIGHQEKLRSNKNILRQILRHECLHFIVGLGHDGAFKEEAIKRNIHYLNEQINNTREILGIRVT